MANKSAQIVICGAGMAGVATAYHLAVKQNIKNIVLVDERKPLTLTSNKGNEGYRNWWPDAAMFQFMTRSIDLLEELAHQTNNHFQMNRRGYALLTANPNQIPTLTQTATNLAALGAGPVRHHPNTAQPYRPGPFNNFVDAPPGVDLLPDTELIHRHYPFVAKDVVAMLHVRRCGWLDTQRLGHWLLEQAQAHGVRLLQDRVVGVTVTGGRVEAVQLQRNGSIGTGTFVAAAGPYLKQVGAMLGVNLPVFTELHGKIAFKDSQGVIPPGAPYLIWNDPLDLPWTEAERNRLHRTPETRWLLDEFPAEVRFRMRPPTTANNSLVMGMWSYNIQPQKPVWPPKFSPYFAQALLRGLSKIVPGLQVYFGQESKAIVDGGYYCKTQDNRPLIGPLPVEGAYVIGALSGYGIMGAQAAAELLAAHITGGDLPGYAPAFLVERTTAQSAERWKASGQL